MTDLQWKIEGSRLRVKIGGKWRDGDAFDGAHLIRATQEKCARWHDERANSCDGEATDAALLGLVPNRVKAMEYRGQSHREYASAIRALKMETGHG